MKNEHFQKSLQYCRRKGGNQPGDRDHLGSNAQDLFLRWYYLWKKVEIERVLARDMTREFSMVCFLFSDMVLIYSHVMVWFANPRKLGRTYLYIYIYRRCPLTITKSARGANYILVVEKAVSCQVMLCLIWNWWWIQSCMDVYTNPLIIMCL